MNMESIRKNDMSVSQKDFPSEPRKIDKFFFEEHTCKTSWNTFFEALEDQKKVFFEMPAIFF